MTEENAQDIMASLVLLEQKVLALNDTNAELRAEVERLRGALERIKAVPESITALRNAATTIAMMSVIARNALNGGDHE